MLVYMWICFVPIMFDFWFAFLYVMQLVKLLEQREANHIEFCRIKNVLDEILHMYKNSELKEILKLLMDPTWVATGLKIDFDILVSRRIWLCRLFLHFHRMCILLGEKETVIHVVWNRHIIDKWMGISKIDKLHLSLLINEPWQCCFITLWNVVRTLCATESFGLKKSVTAIGMDSIIQVAPFQDPTCAFLFRSIVILLASDWAYHWRLQTRTLQLVQLMIRLFCALIPIDSFGNDIQRLAKTQPRACPCYGLSSGL